MGRVGAGDERVAACLLVNAAPRLHGPGCGIVARGAIRQVTEFEGVQGWRKRRHAHHLSVADAVGKRWPGLLAGKPRC